jgi:multiple sugar transport system ATP-binding protein
VPGVVVLTEPTGGDLWVLAEWEGCRVKGRAAPGVSLARGDRLRLVFDPARVHLFDRESGERAPGS